MARAPSRMPLRASKKRKLFFLALQQYSWVFFGMRCRVSDEPRELTWLLGKPGGDTFLFAPTPPKEGWRGGEWAKKMFMAPVGSYRAEWLATLLPAGRERI